MSSFREVPIADFEVPRHQLGPTRTVRSTLICASMQALRQRGLADAYAALHSPEWAEKLLSTPAGVWLPIEWGERHYEACDRLGLSDDQVLSMGNAVAEITQKTAFSFAARLAREVGATATTIIGVCPRLWKRLFEGGGVAAFQTGPKDARFETVGVPLAKYRYWRVGYRGIIRALIQPLTRTLVVRETRTDASSVTMKISWV